MKINKGLIVLITASFILMSAGLGFAQEQPQQKEAPAASEPEMQWLWGEVINLDPHNKMILVKYLDYETEQERQAAISVDEKTTYENITSIEELKQNDAVSVDYIISPDGKNIARIISLEKPEASTENPEEAVKSLNAPESQTQAPQQ